MDYRDELISYVSDAYKDVNGIRSRGVCGEYEMSISELEALCSKLSDEVGIAIVEEKAREARAAVRFEASIAKTIEIGAGDRETAVRWLVEADDAGRDDNFFKYLNGLAYEYPIWTGVAA